MTGGMQVFFSWMETAAKSHERYSHNADATSPSAESDRRCALHLSSWKAIEIFATKYNTDNASDGQDDKEGCVMVPVADLSAFLESEIFPGEWMGEHCKQQLRSEVEASMSAGVGDMDWRGVETKVWTCWYESVERFLLPYLSRDNDWMTLMMSFKCDRLGQATAAAEEVPH